MRITTLTKNSRATGLGQQVPYFFLESNNHKQLNLSRISYSQPCSNNHLYKTTTRLRRPVLSLPKPISMQSLLYKTTTWLMRPATTFFVHQMKKSMFKRLQKFIQCVKINVSTIIFTLLPLLMQSLFKSVRVCLTILWGWRLKG